MDIAEIEAAMKAHVLPDGGEVVAVRSQLTDEAGRDEVVFIATVRHPGEEDLEVYARLPLAWADEANFDPSVFARAVLGHASRTRYAMAPARGPIDGLTVETGRTDRRRAGGPLNRPVRIRPGGVEPAGPPVSSIIVAVPGGRNTVETRRGMGG